MFKVDIGLPRGFTLSGSWAVILPSTIIHHPSSFLAVSQDLAVDLGPERFFTRCVKCNGHRAASSVWRRGVHMGEWRNRFGERDGVFPVRNTTVWWRNRWFRNGGFLYIMYQWNTWCSETAQAWCSPWRVTRRSCVLPAVVDDGVGRCPCWPRSKIAQRPSEHRRMEFLSSLVPSQIKFNGHVSETSHETSFCLLNGRCREAAHQPCSIYTVNYFVLQLSRRKALCGCEKPLVRGCQMETVVLICFSQKLPSHRYSLWADLLVLPWPG